MGVLNSVVLNDFSLWELDFQGCELRWVSQFCFLHCLQKRPANQLPEGGGGEDYPFHFFFFNLTFTVDFILNLNASIALVYRPSYFKKDSIKDFTDSAAWLTETNDLFSTLSSAMNLSLGGRTHWISFAASISPSPSNSAHERRRSLDLICFSFRLNAGERHHNQSLYYSFSLPRSSSAV